MKKRHEAINKRNAKILALYTDGVAMKQIAEAVSGSLGLVAGIVHRAGIKNRGAEKPVVAPSIVGKVFGRVTVLEQNGSDKHGHGLVRCLCSCGKTFTAKAQHIKDGGTKSCGCLVREAALNRKRKVCKTPEWPASHGTEATLASN